MGPDAQRWIELAAYDLATAEAMLASGRYLYVLFCCQQAIEKHLKALLTDRTGEFPPRTHDLVKLAQAVTILLREDQDLFLRELTKYYIGTRYPEEVSLLATEATREVTSRYLSLTKEFLEWLVTLQK